jgi:hypothetical protein
MFLSSITCSNAILKRFRFHILLKTFTKFYYHYKDLVYNHNSTIKDLTKKGYFPFMMLTVNSFGKAFLHVRNWLLTKKNMTHWIEWWNWIKHWRILYENDTKKRIQLCVKIKKRCYTDLLHFSTCEHKLVFFFLGRINFNSRITSYFFYIFFFFQEKTLGDISFKLDTKIMNFMSVFFSKKI